MGFFTITPRLFSRFRGVGEVNDAVSVVNDTRVAFAPLKADVFCGNQARLIYYMDPGEVLSRPFTARDTHSHKGELLVKHTDAKLTGGEYALRSMGTWLVLGVHGLSFTYDSDLVLPAEINNKLREVLRVAMGENGSTENVDGKVVFDTHEVYNFLDTLSSNFSGESSIFIPEVCVT